MMNPPVQPPNWTLTLNRWDDDEGVPRLDKEWREDAGNGFEFGTLWPHFSTQHGPHEYRPASTEAARAAISVIEALASMRGVFSTAALGGYDGDLDVDVRSGRP